MKRYWQIQFPAYDTPGDGSGGGGTGNPGAGGDGATGTGATGATGTPGASGTPAAGATGTGQVANPGQPAATGFTYKEDRTDWVPRHRLNEVAGKSKTLEQQLQDANRRIQALAGVTPAKPGDAEAEQVRQAFAQMFPHLGKLSEEKIDRILALADQGEQLTETTKHYWQNHGLTMVNSAGTQIAEAMGVDKLSETQARRVGREYAAWLNEDFEQAKAEGRAPALVARHEKGDQSLVKEFVDQFVADFVTPAQRRAVQANVNRVSQRVPSGRGTSNAPVNSKPKIDFTNEQAIEDAAVAAFAAHGGAFKR